MAGIKISELPAAGTIIGNEVVPIVQDSCTKYAAASAIGGGSDICSIASGSGLVGGGSTGNICLAIDNNCLSNWDSTYTTVKASSGNWDQSACGGINCEGNVISNCNTTFTLPVWTISNCLIDSKLRQNFTDVVVDATLSAIGGVETDGNILSAGVDLSSLMGGGGLADAPSDGNDYVRCDASWITAPGAQCVGDITSVAGTAGLSGAALAGAATIGIDSGTLDPFAKCSADNVFSGANEFTGTSTHRDTISGTQITIGKINSVTGDTGCTNSIIGGSCNTIAANGAFNGCNMIAGGLGGCINCAANTFIGGGSCGCIDTGATSSGIIGGSGNTIKTNHCRSAVVGGTAVASVSANMLHTQSLFLKTLPTSDPGVPGVVWSDGGTLKVSL